MPPRPADTNPTAVPEDVRARHGMPSRTKSKTRSHGLARDAGPAVPDSPPVDPHVITLGLMAGTLSHELRNVLTPVLGYLQVARARPDDADLARKAVERAVEGLETAREILDAALDVRDADQVPAAPAEGADVLAAARRAIEYLVRDPERDRIEIDLRVPASARALIRPVALTQVFLNLLLNATRALQRRGGRVVVSSRPAGHDAIEITVADDGPGLPEDVLERLFEPFAAHASGRTGLGLAVCRQLAEEAGGAIVCRSTSERGTTFALRLPRPVPQLAHAG